jgi:hypothetical protein
MLGMPPWGKRTKSCMQTCHRYAHNQRTSCFRPQCSNGHNLLEYGQTFFKQVSLGASVQCPWNILHWSSNVHKRCLCDFLNFRTIILAKLSRSVNQHPSNSARLMRRFVRGLSIYVHQFSFLLIFDPNSRRVPRVGRVWLAQAHTQTFQTPPSTSCVPNGQVGPRPTPKPIALACLRRAMFIQTCAMCVFARLLSKNITRACGVSFRVLFTHPQTKPRTLNTVPTPPNPLQKVP